MVVVLAVEGAAVVVYLCGPIREALPEGVGLMLSPKHGVRPDLLTDNTRAFAVDNGCYLHPEDFVLGAYLRWLGGYAAFRNRCLFATCPDMPADWARTLDRFAATVEAVRETGFPIALCAQNGATEGDVPWSEIDVLFIGGRAGADGREWKTSQDAWALIAAAKRRGKWVHQGRVNSLLRLRTAQLQGADSADGTFVQRAARNNLPLLQRWLDELARQPPLIGLT